MSGWPRWVAAAAALALGALSLLVARAAPGDLDPTFGSGGQVVTDFNGRYDVARALAILPDGKIVAAGEKNAFESTSDFAAARYHPDGSLDTAFGVGGRVATDFDGWYDTGYAVAVQPDGQVIVAGEACDTFSGSYEFGLVRYQANGALDPTFGSGGRVTTRIDDTDAAEAFAVAVQWDGKIVAAGYADYFWDVNFALVRYQGDGTLDTAFGVGGMVTVPVSSLYDMGRAVAIQPDGKIVVAGYAHNGTDYDLALARYTSNGTMDAQFGSGGSVTTDLDSDDYGYAVAVQRDGKIVVAGHTGYWPEFDVVLARYERDGTLDAAFGNGGVVITDLEGGPEMSYAVVVQADGKIVVTGQAYDPDTGWDTLLARYTMDGVLDAGFGSGGVVLTDLSGNGHDGSYSIALQADGRIVVAGATEGALDDFALARYDTRVTGAASVAGEPVSIGETNVRARFDAGGPCTVSVTKTIAFLASSSVFRRMPMYWDISTDCGGAYDLTLALCYTDAELYNGTGVTEDELAVFKRTGGQNWENQGGTVDPEANCVTLNGVTSPGSWTLGSPPLHVYLPLVAR